MNRDNTPMKKIHIIGSIGSGKTTLAKKVSNIADIPHYELDNIVYKRTDIGDIRRSDRERDAYLNRLIKQERWIIEGAHHKWVSKSFHEADIILFLDIALPIRKYRIVNRFFKQKLGMEKANYKPALRVLKILYKYNNEFDSKSKPEILGLLELHKNKVIVIKNKNDVEDFIELLEDTHSIG